jgi:hypothetical protein
MTTQQLASLPRPAPDDREGWKKYWKAQGQPWRAEPEIDEERQKFLSERRAITPDIEKGIYSFKGIRLSRADVEWLLATHDDGRGPVDEKDENLRTRRGVDIRGADLCYVDLGGLPLARTLGSLTWDEWSSATEEQRDMAAVLMEGVDLSDAELFKAFLRRARLKGAKFFRARLEETYLREANLDEADLSRAKLGGAYLIGAQLRRAKLQEAQFGRADLEYVILADENQVGPWVVDADWHYSGTCRKG